MSGRPRPTEFYSTNGRVMDRTIEEALERAKASEARLPIPMTCSAKHRAQAQRCRASGWGNELWRTTTANIAPSGPWRMGQWKSPWRTGAPIHNLSCRTASPSSPAIALISMRCAGRARRKAMIGTRLCPASTRPSCGASSLSSVTASPKVAGQCLGERRGLHRFSSRTVVARDNVLVAVGTPDLHILSRYGPVDQRDRWIAANTR